MAHRSGRCAGRSVHGPSPKFPRRDRGVWVDHCTRTTAPAIRFHLLTAICILLMFLGSSCSFDYGEAPGAARPDTPNLDLTGARYQAARSAEQRIQFTADRLRIYDAKDTAIMEGVTFVQYGGRTRTNPEAPMETENQILATGSCRTTELTLSSNDARLEGTIIIRSEQRGATLTAESLIWDHSRERLSSGPAEQVTITFDDGTLVTGVGFIGRMDLNTYEFTESSEGSIVYE